jgi:hypothetical protein
MDIMHSGMGFIKKRCNLYQLSCRDCKKKYTGHTGKKIDKMCKGHFLYFKNNNNNSKLPDQDDHSFGKINDTVAMLYLPKGNTLGNRGESLCLQRISYRKLSQR